MSDGMSITLEGERELFLKMEYRLEGCEKAGRRGLRKGALKIVNDAKGKLKTNGSVVTGMLRASGKVQAVEGNPDAVDAGFFSQDTKGGYAYFVEYGRRAGKMPPVEMLMEWLRKRTSKSKALRSAVNILEGRRKRREAAYTKDDLLRSAAWGLARHIAKKGTRPHPFFGPAVEENKNAVNEYIAEEVSKDTKRDGK
jgi:hypothetical protein